MTSYSEAREVMLRSYLSSVDLVQPVDQSVMNQIFATIFELVKLAGMFDPGAIKTWINNSANLVASIMMVVDCVSIHKHYKTQRSISVINKWTRSENFKCCRHNDNRTC